MNDLDALLRQDGRSWHTPPVAPPDLPAALERHETRRSRLLVAGALVAVVALGAGTGVLLNRPGPSVPAVPDPMATSSSSSEPSPSTTPSPTPPEASPPEAPGMDEVEAAVKARASQQGIAVSGEAVRTTWREAKEILRTKGSGPAGNTEVWLAQVDGEFSCEDCQTEFTGEEAGSSHLIVVLDAVSLEVYHLEGNHTKRRLESFGTPVKLDTAW